MKRRRRSRDVLAVSLFPFLAVLICTLGVLIVLLVLAVKSAETHADEAQQSTDAEARTQLDAIERAQDARAIQIDGLKLVRPEAIARLNEARTVRSHYEQELRQMDREATVLAEELLALELQRKGLQQESEPDIDTAEIRSQIELAKRALAEKRKAATAVGPVKWSIVAHHGGGGTFRRPIFIECTAEEIILHPVGIRLKTRDMHPPLFPGNMLDVALLTIREYWQRYNLDGEEGQAYPLLVVRPGGTDSYLAAKSAMKSWDDQFGYELVEDEKVLDFGEADQLLAREVQAAIDAARVRHQQQVAQHKARKRQVTSRVHGFKSEQRPGLTVSGSQGGFVSNGVQSSSDYESTPQGSDQPFGSNNRGGDGGETGGHSDKSLGQQAATGSGGGSDQEFEPQQASANVSAEGGMPGGNQSIGDLTQTGDPVLDQADTATAGQAAAASAAKSLAGSRGKDWALPTRTAGATAYLRPIRLVCDSDRLIVRSATHEKAIPFQSANASATAAAVDPLIEEIWRQIEAWGVAGSNGYWKPQLRISVTPGGAIRFQTLRVLLADSGLVIEEAGNGNP